MAVWIGKVIDATLRPFEGIDVEANPPSEKLMRGVTELHKWVAPVLGFLRPCLIANTAFTANWLG